MSFYKDRNIDVFKDSTSQKLKFMFTVLEPDVHFYLFND